MTSLLPPEVSFVEQATPDALAAALRRVLDGARPLRVLVAGAGATPSRLAVAAAVFAPDIVAGAGAPPSGPAAHRAALERWRQRSERERRGVTRRYAVAELLTRGLAPAKYPAALHPLAGFPPRHGVRLLLPGDGGGAVRVALHLASDAGHEGTEWDMRIDGRVAAVRGGKQRIEAAAILAPAPCHSLDVAHSAQETIFVAAVTVGPA